MKKTRPEVLGEASLSNFGPAYTWAPLVTCRLLRFASGALHFARPELDPSHETLARPLVRILKPGDWVPA